MVTTADYIAADMVYAEGAEVDAVYKGDTLLWSNRPAVLNEATLWLDAQYSAAREPRVINRGTGGAALNAKYGSVLGAYVYDGAAVLPGINGNDLSIPDAAALDITGDFELVMRVGARDWTTSDVSLATRSTQADSNRAWWLQLLATGAVRFRWYPAGTSASIMSQTSDAPGFVDGETYWIKVTLDVNDGGSHTVAFYKADDQATEPSSWTLISTHTAASTTALPNVTSPLFVGMTTAFSGEPTASFRRTIVRNGIGGTTVLDIDCADVPDYATSFTATTGQTVTVNSTSSDTNDPKLLTHTGENYVRLPGIAGNSLTTPDAAELDVTGDLEIVARVSLDDWTPSTQTQIAYKYNTNQGYYFAVQTTGLLVLVWGTGSTALVAQGAVTPATALGGVTDGEWLWVKMVMDVDNGAGGHLVSFYVARDSETEPTSWTACGTATGGAGTTTIAAGTAPLTVTAQSAMEMKRMVVRNGIGGTTVFDFNADTDIVSSGASSFTATSGQTVTVSRTNSGRRTVLVTRPVWLFGTDDFLEIADNALLDFTPDGDFTMFVAYRTWPSVAPNALLSKRNSSSSIVVEQGWLLLITATDRSAFLTGDGVGYEASVAANGSLTVGSLTSTAVVMESRTLELLQGNTVLVTNPFGTLGSMANSNPVRIGATPSGALFLDSEVLAVAVWRRALTTDELAAVNTYYGAS